MFNGVENVQFNPLYKSSDQSKLNNFWPISILLCKQNMSMNEVYITNFMNTSLAITRLSNKQFGLRKLHSTMTALVNSINNIVFDTVMMNHKV